MLLESEAGFKSQPRHFAARTSWVVLSPALQLRQLLEMPIQIKDRAML